VQELRLIETKEQFQEHREVLEKLFGQLAVLMIYVQEVGAEAADTLPQSAVSEELRLELCRIYQMEGGRYFIESTQQEALLKIQLHEEQRKKERPPSSIS
jgi:hypothetical protein